MICISLGSVLTFLCSVFGVVLWNLRELEVEVTSEAAAPLTEQALFVSPG